MGGTVSDSYTKALIFEHDPAFQSYLTKLHGRDTNRMLTIFTTPYSNKQLMSLICGTGCANQLAHQRHSCLFLLKNILVYLLMRDEK
ncbi:MAG: hypothetical protein CSA33_01265 [Desulfobulbus propionicus]|nr:MAG: hypothetical protein CSA33_01265 [Desulfobulbus propionicus]